MDYLTTYASLSPLPIRCGFTPGFVNYRKEGTRLATASDKVDQLLAHGRWFSPGTPAPSTTKTGRHDITEILLKVALSTINQSSIIISLNVHREVCRITRKKNVNKQYMKTKNLPHCGDSSKDTRIETHNIHRHDLSISIAWHKHVYTTGLPAC